MHRWYLVRTKPNAEFVAAENLARQGYCVYFPRLGHASHRGGRWRERIVPLFPGYLFLGLDEGRQALSPVGSTTGVAQAVRFGSAYAVVPDAIVAALRERECPENGLHRLNSHDRIAPGTRVRIFAGPFEGLAGVFQRESGPERAIVLLSVLGQVASVGVPVANIIAERAA